MKTKRLNIAIALLAVALIGTSCGNKQQKSSSDTTTEQATSSALEIDSLLANAESLAGQEVTIEGVCTHTCKHGARKIFLMGSDDTQVIRVEAGTLGAFDPKCVNSIVRVTGTLKEQRIDEAYLQNWEAQLKAQAAEKHGDGEAGCDSEKKARGETASTPEARIADFRAKIADRKANSGKEYLSFYFMEANSYVIETQRLNFPVYPADTLWWYESFPRHTGYYLPPTTCETPKPLAPNIRYRFAPVYKPDNL